MAQNIYEILVTENPKLAAKLNTNEEISGFLMTLYAHLLEIAVKSDHDAKNMICFVDIGRERLLRVRVQYYGAERNSGAVGTKNPTQRNMNLVKFLEVNRNVKSVAERTVSILERWVNDDVRTRAQGFSQIKLMNAIHHTDDTFTAELVVKYEFDEFVDAKMKWNLNDDETVSEGGIITL